MDPDVPDSNIYAPPVESPSWETAAPEYSPTDGPKGIGGWLLLPLFGMIATPIQLIRVLISNYVPIVEHDWATLTDETYESYHPWWAPLVVYEIVGMLLIASAAIIAVFLIFRHDRRLPKLMISIYAANLCYVVIDTVVAAQVPALNTAEMPAGVTDLVRALVVASVWVPYFLKSKRVANTFVK